MHGTLSGGINGRAVDFTINWDGGAKGRYVGYVNEDGSWAGTTGDSGWKGLGPLKCLTPNNPLPPEPAPEAEQIPNRKVPTTLEQQAPPNVATVLKASTVYDKPDGEGIPYLDANGDDVFLRVGEQRALVEPCDGAHPGWCHLVVPEVDGPAWVFKDQGYLKV
jgi:hypothetical protein